MTTILTAKLDYLDRSIAVFIRLKDALHFDNLNEVSRPVRFVCFIAGPVDELVCDYIEVGRCFGVLMSNPQFLTYAYVSEVGQSVEYFSYHQSYFIRQYLQMILLTAFYYERWGAAS